LHDAEAVMRAHGASESKRRTDGARILLVEDSEDFCLLMDLTLREAGYRVDCATCAEDALRLMETRRYHLLLSDYSLPGYSGVWLLRQAFERHLLSPDAALMITGDPDAPGVRDAARVIPKPVDFDGFIPQIRAALETGSRDAASGVAA
jgi:DNA-binding response OmpR family regulator